MGYSYRLNRFDPTGPPAVSLQVKAALEALCNAVTALDTSKTPVISVLDGSCVGSGYALAMGKYK